MANPRYDKYEPRVGGFRAVAAENWHDANVDKITGVGLDTSGRVVRGGGATGIIAVVVSHGSKNIGDILDNMTSGEIVDVPATFTPGATLYAAAADGVVSTTSGGKKIGYIADSGRLIVRVAQ